MSETQRGTERGQDQKQEVAGHRARLPTEQLAPGWGDRALASSQGGGVEPVERLWPESRLGPRPGPWGTWHPLGFLWEASPFHQSHSWQDS